MSHMPSYPMPSTPRPAAGTPSSRLVTSAPTPVLSPSSASRQVAHRAARDNSDTVDDALLCAADTCEEDDTTTNAPLDPHAAVRTQIYANTSAVPHSCSATATTTKREDELNAPCRDRRHSRCSNSPPPRGSSSSSDSSSDSERVSTPFSFPPPWAKHTTRFGASSSARKQGETYSDRSTHETEGHHDDGDEEENDLLDSDDDEYHLRECRGARHGPDVLSITTLQRNLDSLGKEVAHVMGHVGDRVGKRRGTLDTQRVCMTAERRAPHAVAVVADSGAASTDAHPMRARSAQERHEKTKTERAPACDRTDCATSSSSDRGNENTYNNDSKTAAASAAAAAAAVLRNVVAAASSPPSSSPVSSSLTLPPARQTGEIVCGESVVVLPKLSSAPAILPVAPGHPTMSSFSVPIPPLVSVCCTRKDSRSSSDVNIRNSINSIDVLGCMSTVHNNHGNAHSVHNPLNIDSHTLLSTSALTGTSQASLPSKNSNSTSSNINANAAKTRQGRITVVVRKRPMHSHESGTDCVRVSGSQVTLSVTRQRVDLTTYTESNTLTFDHVFDTTASNACVHRICTRELLDVALRGGSASCFAYGQTGSGKTYTMLGRGSDEKESAADAAAPSTSAVTRSHANPASISTSDLNAVDQRSSPALTQSSATTPHPASTGTSVSSDASATKMSLQANLPIQPNTNSALDGLYQLAAMELFTRRSSTQTISVSFFEIYCNSLFDLLHQRSPVVLREDRQHRVHLRGLSWHTLTDTSHLLRLTQQGLEQRRTGSTGANEHSSRSHAILTLRIEDANLNDNNDDGNYAPCCGMVHYVDLAGSERAADTASHDRLTRQEGAEINKSLLALKECIRALDEKKRHIPFRGSRLTEVLRDSFTGVMSRTVMIANVSPSSADYEHTANTLRYAFRVQGLSVPRISPSRERNAPRMFLGNINAVSAAAAAAAAAAAVSPQHNKRPPWSIHNATPASVSALGTSAGLLPLFVLPGRGESGNGDDKKVNRDRSRNRRPHRSSSSRAHNSKSRNTSNRYKVNGNTDKDKNTRTSNPDRDDNSSNVNIISSSDHNISNDNINGNTAAPNPLSHAAHPLARHRSARSASGTKRYIHRRRRHSSRSSNNCAGCRGSRSSRSRSSASDDSVIAKDTDRTRGDVDRVSAERRGQQAHHSRQPHPCDRQHRQRKHVSHRSHSRRRSRSAQSGSGATSRVRGGVLHELCAATRRDARDTHREEDDDDAAAATTPSHAPACSSAISIPSPSAAGRASSRRAQPSHRHNRHRCLSATQPTHSGTSRAKKNTSALAPLCPENLSAATKDETSPAGWDDGLDLSSSSDYHPLRSLPPATRRGTATTTACASPSAPSGQRTATTTSADDADTTSAEADDADAEMSSPTADPEEHRRERAFRQRVMHRLRRDLAKDIHAILDERDRLITTLKEENVQLRGRIATLEKRMDE